MKLKMLFFFLIYVNLNAQFKPLRIGFLFGKATQQRSPLNNKNYTYSNDFYKLSIMNDPKINLKQTAYY